MVAPALRARAAALDLLGAVLRKGRSLDEALAAHEGLKRLAPRDRAFAELLLRTSLRRLGEIDALLDLVLDEPRAPKPGRPHDILRLGCAELVFLKVPPHAAVSSAVALAETLAPKLKALVNAVLRRIAREGEARRAGWDAARLDTPAWLWRRWVERYGEAEARAIASSHLAEPPLDLTVKGDGPRWAERLGGKLLADTTVRLDKKGPVRELPGYREGAWWVQDFAAAWPARFLAPPPGARALDACAAPGGKSAQLALAGARVSALDRSPTRLARLRENLARLGLKAELVLADLLDYAPAERFAFILLDAPCSATGAIRRHPDIAHRRTPADIAALAQRQDELLDAALRLLAPGGRLVYSVCSLEPEEGEARITALIERHPELAHEALAQDQFPALAALGPFFTPAGDFQSLPNMLPEFGGCDGFYAARLRLRG